MGAAQKGGFIGNGPGNAHGLGKGDLEGTDFNDHIMGTKGDDVVNGQAGNDVIIGFAGHDVLVGGAGSDNISGGSGDDVLVGGVWTDDGDGVMEVGGWTLTTDNVDNTQDVWTFTSEFSGDADRDVFVAGSSFADNGTDSIMGYQAEDVVDLNAALGATFAALDLADDATANGSVDLFAAGYISYDPATGALSVDTDGAAGQADSMNVWFTVQGTTLSAANGDTFIGETPPADTSTTAPPAEIAIVVGGYTIETPAAV